MLGRTLRGFGLLLLVLGITGCAAGGGWAATGVLVLSLATLGLAGCAESHGRSGRDAGTPIVTPDAGEGTWETCCVEGAVDTCFCPAGVECNYGWFDACADGTCAEPGGCAEEDAGVDAGLDAGPEGTWEPCCEGGVVTTCFCPAGVECNYGWYTDCGGGACAFGPDECGDAGPADAGPPDAGPPDAGGYWEPCCTDGVIESCFCPADVACNYGWFTDCGGGTCAFTPDECPAP